jgi:uncharacterized repeat protein (TIGR03803 family)
MSDSGEQMGCEGDSVRANRTTRWDNAARAFIQYAFIFLAASMFAVEPFAEAYAASFQVIHAFCGQQCNEGSVPTGGMTPDSKGNFYGSTAEGGKENLGTVYELAKGANGSWTLQTLYSFCTSGGLSCLDGYYPTSPPIIDSVGNLYGTDTNIFAAGRVDSGRTTKSFKKGVIYELQPNAQRTAWTFVLLHRFCSKSNCADGSQALTGLTYLGAASGAPYNGRAALYGVTKSGGAFGRGEIYQIKPAHGLWYFSIIYSFCADIQNNRCLDGTTPGAGATLIMDANGNLYGTTSAGGSGAPVPGGGTIFRLSPNAGATSWSYSVLYNFCSATGCSDGESPYGGLVMDKTGAHLFGATAFGGGNADGGVAYELTLGSPTEYAALSTFCPNDSCVDGNEPSGSLNLNNTGILYGTTYFGGGYPYDYLTLGGGTVFKLSGSKWTVLYRFCSDAVGLDNCPDGFYPDDKPLLDSSGNIYGTTNLGGQFGGGVVFEITP